jgi:hypothetical protein
MSEDIRKMIDKVKNFKQFVNENVENNTDRTKMKSKHFFISNSYKNNDGIIKYIEFKPFNNNIVDKIYIHSNSVVFYRNGEPIDEMRNINMDSNEELGMAIENRLSNLV